MTAYTRSLTDSIVVIDAPTVAARSQLWTAGANLKGTGLQAVKEAAPDWVNRIPTKRPDPLIDFTFGIRAVDATDTTFTSSTVTFAATSVSSVTQTMAVETVDSFGVHQYANVLGVDLGVVTVDRWVSASNWAYGVVSPPAAAVPSSGSRVLISQFGAVFSYTVGATVYPQNGPLAYKYDIGDGITFSALVEFPPLSQRYAAKFYWDFGDGVRGTGPNVTHVFTAPVTRNVVLTVIDNEGRRWTASKRVYVSPVTRVLVHPGIIVG